MWSASEVLVFYVRLFTLFGIQLRPKAENEKFGWRLLRRVWGIFNVLETGLFFLGSLSLLVFMGAVGIKCEGNVIDLNYFTQMLMAYFLLSLLTPIYFRFVTKSIDFAEAIEIIIKFSCDQNYNLKVNKNVRNCLIFNMIICSLHVILFVVIFVFAAVKYHRKLSDVLIFGIVPYSVTLGFFQSYCILFFSVLMELLTDSLAPLAPNLALLSSEFLINYERARELAGKVNRVFSPVLALTCAINLFAIALLLAFPYIRFLGKMVMFNPAAIFNFISCLICLNSVIKCNGRRLKLVRKLDNCLYEVNKLPLKLMKRSTDFHYWLINIMLKDEDFFNIGCYFQMDEAIFLMIFQNIFDMCVSLRLKYTFTFLLEVDEYNYNQTRSNTKI